MKGSLIYELIFNLYEFYIFLAMSIFDPRFGGLKKGKNVQHNLGVWIFQMNISSFLFWCLLIREGSWLCCVAIILLAAQHSHLSLAFFFFFLRRFAFPFTWPDYCCLFLGTPLKDGIESLMAMIHQSWCKKSAVGHILLSHFACEHCIFISRWIFNETFNNIVHIVNMINIIHSVYSPHALCLSTVRNAVWEKIYIY